VENVATNYYEMPVIGYVRSCYKEKFGVPRQSGLVSRGEMEIMLLPEYSNRSAVEGLGQFSHIWVIYCFHLSMAQGWKPKVKPPRLGGNRSLGIFATRTPFRPSPLGLSAVRLNNISFHTKQILLSCSAGDIVDGSPVLDIKPYLPYADSLADARAGYANSKPEQKMEVLFSQAAEQSLSVSTNRFPELRELISQVLALDPRPQYKSATDNRLYGIALYDFDIKWRVTNQKIVVEKIVTRQTNCVVPENHLQTD
jgi:tRNA-Thr(GGU) m(6)t(6)A37 methyltransferase TsaA